MIMSSHMLHVMNNKYVTMQADGFYIPKTNPSKPLGEDSYFINKKSKIIGVADGVGGWSKKGIDAGKYARELMANAASASAGFQYPILRPKHVLVKAFSKTKSQGSSTACIISLCGKVLRAVNLGDSGFLVIREGKTVYKSPVQQHSFNYPYQIGNGRNRGPEQAYEIAVAVEEGDVVIVGTDGLFDNMFVEGIEKIVRLCMADQSSPNLMALKLAMAAHRKSLEQDSVTPFQLAAQKAKWKHVGGKPDDITVVAAYICAAT